MATERCGRRRQVLTTVCTVILLAGACSGNGSDDAQPAPTSDTSTTSNGVEDASTDSDESELSPFEDDLAAALGEEGEMSIELALEVVATAYGDVPGVETTLDPSGLGDTFAAQQVLRRHLDELTPEQRAALTEHLTPDPANLVATIDPMSDAEDASAAGRLRAVSFPLQERSRELEVIARDALERIDERLVRPPGVRLETPVHVYVVSSDAFRHAGDAILAGPGQLVEADVPTCHIRISQRTVDGDERSLRSTVAHEVFHCVQAYFEESDSPPWVIEGQAEWVGEELAGGSPSSAGNWDHWLRRTDTSLLRRSYTAIGFYGSLQAEGIDPWDVLVPMLQAGGGRAPLHAALGTDDDSSALMLGRRLVRSPAHGPQWESQGPGITAARGTVPLRVRAGGTTSTTRHLPTFSSVPIDLTIEPDPEAPLLIVTVEGGLLEIASTRRDSILVRGSIALCTSPGECTCPSAAEPLPALDIGSDVVATLTSVEASQTGTRFERSTLEDACEAQPADVPTLRMTGAVNLDLAGGYCMTDGVGYFLWIGAGGSVNDIPQPEPYPDALFRYYASMSRLGTTTDAGSVSWGLSSDDQGGGSTFSIAPDGLSGTFSLDDGHSGSYTCPRLLTEAEVYGSG